MNSNSNRTWTGWLMDILIGDDDTPSQPESITNHAEFVSTLNRLNIPVSNIARTDLISKFSLCAQYFIQNQTDQSVIDAFFKSDHGYLEKLSDLLRNSLALSSDHHLDHSTLSCLQILYFLLHNINIEDNPTFSALLFSNGTLQELLCDISKYPSMRQSREFSLILREIVLKLSLQNIHYFISQDTGELRLLRIVVGLLSTDRQDAPTAHQVDYHLKVLQKNLILQIGKLLNSNSIENNPNIQIIKEFIQQYITVEVAGCLNSAESFAQIIDHLFFIDDLLSVFGTWIYDDVWSRLPKNSILICLAVDILSKHYSAQMISIIDIHCQSAFEYFLRILTLRTVLSHCKDKSILDQLNILPLKQARQSSILNELLFPPESSSQNYSNSPIFSINNTKVDDQSTEHNDTVSPTRTSISIHEKQEETLQLDTQLSTNTNSFRRDHRIHSYSYQVTSTTTTTTLKSEQDRIRKRQSEPNLLSRSLYNTTQVSELLYFMDFLLSSISAPIETDIRMLFLWCTFELFYSLFSVQITLDTDSATLQFSNNHVKVYEMLCKEHQEFVNLIRDRHSSPGTETPNEILKKNNLLMEYLKKRNVYDFLEKWHEKLFISSACAYPPLCAQDEPQTDLRNNKNDNSSLCILFQLLMFGI